MKKQSLIVPGALLCCVLISGRPVGAERSRSTPEAPVRVTWVQPERLTTPQRVAWRRLMAAVVDGPIPRGELVRDSRPRWDLPGIPNLLRAIGSSKSVSR